jgi:hypothetical protein
VYFLWGKGGRFVGLTNLPTSYADCLEIWNPQGLSRHVMGLLLRKENQTSLEKLWINCPIVYRPKNQITETYSCDRITFLQSTDYRDLSSVAVVTVLWPKVQMFSKHSSPELRNYLRQFPADSCLPYSCTEKKNALFNCVPGSRHVVATLHNREMPLPATDW